ncbi:MAG: HAD hydrolase-like protein [Limnohabitans sp.]|nr:HAD hydrolase-like protein [Limnohabitans sp.]MDI9311186.1 HAD hydrolase-like protein [Limnohabitans sp.]
MIDKTLLIFDIDGTLCNTKEISDNCFIETFKKIYNYDYQSIEWENFKNITDEALFYDLYKFHFSEKPTLSEIQNFKNQYYKQLLKLTNKFNLVKGANELLLKCKQNNTPIAIATGSWLNIALLKMNATKLNYLNIPISSSNDSFKRTEIVKSVISKSKQFYNTKNFKNITYFGDGLWDKKCCEDLGINFIGVDIDNNQKLKLADTKTIINDFTQIKNINNEYLSIYQN